MLYHWEDVLNIYGYPSKVREALAEGQLYKINRGLYSDTPYANPFGIIAAKYPFAIITMDTAFYIHGLTDVVPDTTHLATRRNATRIMDADVTQVFASDRIFSQGMVQMDYDGVSINIYDKERMLIEAMRNSKSMPFDYYKEIITSYRAIHETLDFQKIEEYMALFKRNQTMFNILQREVT